MDLKGVRGKLDGTWEGEDGTQRETEAAQHGAVPFLLLLPQPCSRVPESHVRLCLTADGFLASLGHL